MTRFGAATGAVGAFLVIGGRVAGWRPLVVVGAGIVALVLAALGYVLSHPKLALERTVERTRVEKGRPAR